MTQLRDPMELMLSFLSEEDEEDEKRIGLKPAFTPGLRDPLEMVQELLAAPQEAPKPAYEPVLPTASAPPSYGPPTVSDSIAYDSTGTSQAPPSATTAPLAAPERRPFVPPAVAPAMAESTMAAQPQKARPSPEDPFSTGLKRGAAELGQTAGTVAKAVGAWAERTIEEEPVEDTYVKTEVQQIIEFGSEQAKKVIARPLVVLKELGQQAEDYFTKVAEQFQPPADIEGNLVDNPELLAKGSWWAWNIGTTIPSLAATMAPGFGAGAGVKIGAGVFKWSPALVARLARVAPAVTAGAAGGTMEGAQTYKEVLSRGGTEAEAESAAIMMGLAVAGLNAISFDKLAKAIPDGTARRKVVDFLKRGTTEGLTEALEEPAEASIISVYGLTDSVVREFSEAGKNALTVFPIAGIAGLAGGGVGSQVGPRMATTEDERPAPVGDLPSTPVPGQQIEVPTEAQPQTDQDDDVEILRARLEVAGASPDQVSKTVALAKSGPDGAQRANDIADYWETKRKKAEATKAVETTAPPSAPAEPAPTPRGKGRAYDVLEAAGVPADRLVRAPREEVRDLLKVQRLWEQQSMDYFDAAREVAERTGMQHDPETGRFTPEVAEEAAQAPTEAEGPTRPAKVRPKAGMQPGDALTVEGQDAEYVGRGVARIVATGARVRIPEPSRIGEAIEIGGREAEITEEGTEPGLWRVRFRDSGQEREVRLRTPEARPEPPAETEAPAKPAGRGKPARTSDAIVIGGREAAVVRREGQETLVRFLDTNEEQWTRLNGVPVEVSPPASSPPERPTGRPVEPIAAPEAAQAVTPTPVRRIAPIAEMVDEPVPADADAEVVEEQVVEVAPQAEAQVESEGKRPTDVVALKPSYVSPLGNRIAQEAEDDFSIFSPQGELLAEGVHRADLDAMEREVTPGTPDEEVDIAVEEAAYRAAAEENRRGMDEAAVRYLNLNEAEARDVIRRREGQDALDRYERLRVQPVQEGAESQTPGTGPGAAVQPAQPAAEGQESAPSIAVEPVEAPAKPPVRPPKAVPKKMPASAVIRMMGGLNPRVIERAQKDLPKESGRAAAALRRKINNLGGGSQDIEVMLQDAEAIPEYAAVLRAAGIGSHDDFVNAIRTGRIFEPFDTNPEAAERPEAGMPVNRENLELQVRDARDPEQLLDLNSSIESAHREKLIEYEDLQDLSVMVKQRIKELMVPVPFEEQAPYGAGAVESDAEVDGDAIAFSNPWELTRDDIDAELEAVTDRSHQDDLRALGSEEAVRRYNQLQRQTNSMDWKKADAASAEIEKIEAGLTESQRWLLWGHIDDPRLSKEELGELRQAHMAYDPDMDTSDLIGYLRRELPRVAPGAIAELQDLRGSDVHTRWSELLSAVKIRGALQALQEKGVPEAEIMRGVNRQLEEQGIEADDREVLLREWIDAARASTTGGTMAELGPGGVAEGKPRYEGDLLPGEKRVLPRGPKSTKDTKRLEGTPLFEAQQEEKAGVERKAAQQGDLFGGVAEPAPTARQLLDLFAPERLNEEARTIETVRKEKKTDSGGIRRMFKALQSDMKKIGYHEMRGKVVKSAHEVAKAFQVFSDRHTEALRLIVADADGTVVSHIAYTSKETGYAGTHQLEGAAKAKAQGAAIDGLIARNNQRLRKRLERLQRQHGPLKMWLLHNHPSGNPNPSEDDVRFSSAFASGLARTFGDRVAYEGHVIIDTDQFAWIQPKQWSKDDSRYSLESGKPTNVDPVVPIEVDARSLPKVTNPHTVGQLGLQIKDQDRFVGIIFRTGKEGRLMGIEEVPVGFAMSEDFEGYLRNVRPAYGASEAFVYYGGDRVGRDEFFEKVNPLMRKGLVRDGIYHGSGRMESSVQQRGDTYADIPETIRVERTAEEQAPYDATPDPMDDIPDPGSPEFDVWLDKTLAEHNVDPTAMASPQLKEQGSPLRGSPAPSKPPRPVKAAGRLSTNRPEIIKSLEAVIVAAGRTVPIRVGKIGRKKAAGIFKVQPEIIRLRQANDIPVAAHEIAHALEKATVGQSPGHPWMPPQVSPKMNKELVRLGHELYASGTPAGGYAREGWAEFVMYWMTDEATAKSKAPETVAWFEGTFLKRNQEIADALQTSKAKISEWYAASSTEQVKASIVRPESVKEKVAKFPQVMKRLKKSADYNWVEMGTSLDHLVRAYSQETGKDLTPGEDPFQLFSSYRGTHGRIVRYMVEDGMVDPIGNKIGSPLKDVAAIVGEKREEFGAYLYALRARALLTDPKGPREPGVTLEQAEETIADLETPKFAIAAQKVYEWQDGILDYLSAASPTYAAIVKNIRDRDPGNYIPLFREMDEEQPSGSPKAGTHGAPVARLKGSGRRVLDPFGSMIRNADKMVKAAHKRMVLDAVIRLASVDGMGRLVEKVPVAKIPKSYQVDHTKLLKQIADQTGLDLSGIEETEATMVALTFFEPKAMPGKGENIVPVQTKSGIDWYEVDPALYEILQGMDVYTLPKAAELIFGTPARVFRAGTTGLQASFALITNPMRDPQTMMVNSKATASAPRMFGSWLASMGEAASSQVGKKTEWFDVFQRLAVEMAQPLGQDIAQTERAGRQLFQGRTVKTLDPRNWLDFYRDIIQFPEAAPRLAEMKQIAKDVGWTPGERMTLDQAVAIRLAGKQITTDFTAAGKIARAVNRLVPFHNAAIQGPRVSIRRAGQDPKRLVWRSLTSMTVPTMALWWALKDEDWYKELDYRELFLFWHVPLGDDEDDPIARIPRAFDLGVMFAALPEALLNSWYQDDPETVKRWFGHFAEIATPPVMPVILEEAIEQAANYDLFWEQHIVPRGELQYVPREEQFNEYTTRAAISIGQAIGISPRRVDHAIRGIFGGVGADIAAAFGRGEDGEGGVEKEGEASDLPVIGRMFLRGGKAPSRPKSLDRLYDLAEESQRRQNSRLNPETDEARQRRLMLNDAARATTLLLRMKAVAPKTEARMALSNEILALSRDALARAEIPVTEEVRKEFAETRQDMEKRWAAAAPDRIDPDEKRRAVAWFMAKANAGIDAEESRQAIIRLTDGDIKRFEEELRRTPSPTKSSPSRTAYQVYRLNLRDYTKEVRNRRAGPAVSTADASTRKAREDAAAASRAKAATRSRAEAIRR